MGDTTRKRQGVPGDEVVNPIADQEGDRSLEQQHLLVVARRRLYAYRRVSSGTPALERHP
jgi:hypothetical protein